MFYWTRRADPNGWSEVTFDIQYICIFHINFLKYMIVSGVRSSANDISSDLEMRPFIDRVGPNLKISKTADGLDRKYMEQCWTTIKGIVLLLSHIYFMM